MTIHEVAINPHTDVLFPLSHTFPNRNPLVFPPLDHPEYTNLFSPSVVLFSPNGLFFLPVCDLLFGFF